MKKLILATVAMALGVVCQTHAVPYTYLLTFTAGGVSASGHIVVDNGLATGGSLDVSSGSGPLGSFNLLPANYGQNANGDNFAADNLVTPGGAPFITNNGLQFGGFYTGYALWSDGPSDYELFGYNYYNKPHSQYYLYYGVPDVQGSATLTYVPDGGTTAALLGFGLVGCAVVSRKLKAA